MVIDERLDHVPRPHNFHTISIANNLKYSLANCRLAILTSDLVIISLALLRIKQVIVLFLNLVGDEGLEPPTSSLSVTRSNQLS